ncbi:hypothetical protein AAF712_003258 [Marasmius tenuissimus]|uniref:Uncharacterized protein n=1 Tax=Marasmius tenuissimus TaxID=585030 RepID=A0ABR3A6K5_9AGAR
MSFGFCLVTGVTISFAFDAVFESKRRSTDGGRYSFPWRPLFIIPVIAFPVTTTIALVLLVIVLEAAQPSDGLHCDATHPVWVRFLGYAGSPFIFSVTFSIFFLALNRWRGAGTNTLGDSQTGLTELRPRAKDSRLRHRASLRPLQPLALPTPSPIPSPRRTPARVPINPGFASPTLDARQFHLPFSPLPQLNPDVDDDHDEPLQTPRNENATAISIHSPSEPHSHALHSTKYQNDLSTTYSSTLGDHVAPKQPDYHNDYEDSLADSAVSLSFPRFAPPTPASYDVPLPDNQNAIHQKPSNDFLKYLDEYKEKERQSGGSQLEEVSRDLQWTQKSDTIEWDDLSSLRWNRDDDDYQTVSSSLGINHWASSWTRGALGKFVGNRNSDNDGLMQRGSSDSQRKVTDDEAESYYVTAEDATPRGFDGPDDELFRRETCSSTVRQRASPRERNYQQKPNIQPSPTVASIIKVQLPITLVLLLATLSTLIDAIKQANHPNLSPSPFGTHHVAFLLVAWGPVFALGWSPGVRQALFSRSTRMNANDSGV